MALRVQKFGGTSVADIDRISKVADRVQKAHENGDRMVVVLSAMAGVTNKLISLAGQASNAPDKRELDVLLATGEQTTAALMAMMLISRGFKAKSFLGFQAGIHTDHMSGKARIREIDSQNLREALDEGNIVVVAGFQGADDHGDITTLGRGGSDTSAVAIAASLKADVCEIFTDVDGVYTTDPRICPEARKISRFPMKRCLKWPSWGQRSSRSGLWSLQKNTMCPCMSGPSFNEEEGTMVVNESEDMESPVVSGITCDMNEARITFKRVPDQPGISAKVFGAPCRSRYIRGHDHPEHPYRGRNRPDLYRDQGRF